MKSTLVLGASENPERYAYKAIRMLLDHNQTVFGYGIKEGMVESVKIFTDQRPIENLDTITLYIGPKNQDSIKQYVLDLKPKRVIFNPGTENPEWYPTLEAKGIECEEACTLVLLSTNSY